VPIAGNPFRLWHSTAFNNYPTVSWQPVHIIHKTMQRFVNGKNYSEQNNLASDNLISFSYNE